MMRHTTLARLFSAALVALATVPAGAQDVDPRWHAWLGCWEAVEPESASLSRDRAPRICVIPAGGVAVDVATIVADSIALRQRIEATGQQRAGTRDGCTGWDRATFSQNGQRVYLRTSYTCPGGLTRLSNGVMAMSEEGQWLDVLGVVSGTTKGVRVTRYREVSPSSVPAEVASALRGASQTARIAAMAPITSEDVVEATRYLDPGVVQTWLAERGQGFDLDAQDLVQLEKAGVPSVVIDVMVALSYPRYFALDRSRVTGATRGEAAEQYEGGRTVYVYGWDPYYSPYGYGRYGYGYGYGYGGWYYGNRPIVVVRQPSSGDSEAERHGRVVKGRGYVPGRRSGGDGSGSAATSRGTSGSSGGSASGSSSGATTKSSGSGSGSGRTAKPRPPA